MDLLSFALNQFGVRADSMDGMASMMAKDKGQHLLEQRWFFLLHISLSRSLYLFVLFIFTGYID